MDFLPKLAFAALLLGSTVAGSALAASPDPTGCPPGMHRADSEAGGVGSLNTATRKADSEAGGVGSVNIATHKADSEAGGVGSVNINTHKADSEPGGPSGTQQAQALAPCK